MKKQITNELDSIAKKYGTDKSSEIHNYCTKYEKYLPFQRSDSIRILEIGVLSGQSLKTWSDYFYNSEVIGIDINPDCSRYASNRISIEIGSQTDKSFLTRVFNKYGYFDLIIDDGSHVNSDVIFSFNVLFDYLNSGGVYVVEDSVTSYWPHFGGGLLSLNNSVEFFKRLCDNVNFNGIEYIENPNEVWWRKESNLIPFSKKVQPNCRIDIESINFLNSLILITKR